MPDTEASDSTLDSDEWQPPEPAYIKFRIEDDRPVDLTPMQRLRRDIAIAAIGSGLLSLTDLEVFLQKVSQMVLKLDSSPVAPQTT